MTPESFAHALQHLDPGSRALLDLSVHRGLGDDEIAELLGSDPGYVSSSREAAIAQLADDLGMHGDAERVDEALAEMPEEAWRPQVESGAEAQSESAAENGSAVRASAARWLLRGVALQRRDRRGSGHDLHNRHRDGEGTAVRLVRALPLPRRLARAV